MNLEKIESDFRSTVCEKVLLKAEGMDRFRVFTPFVFEDGDHLSIVMKKEAGAWRLSDEGHTYMHLTYSLDEKDLQKGTRQKIITNALTLFSIHDREGELTIPITDDRYGDALYSFVQALLKITDISYLSRERVRSTFMEDLKTFLEENVPASRRTFDWSDPVHDKEGKYLVDCRINGMAKPILVYGMPSDDKVRDVTISLLQFERWGVPMRSLGIFEDQEEVNRKVLARFSDVCEKQFSSLTSNYDRIKQYLNEAMA